ncbi:hypothetical protein [Granulicella arctica]|uniref:hypothetical protein n=1 Tax=Granulicella arctica TaxID=940613 RepID=UPI0021DF5565|nr:hypothetical protein [Granulicella arctica]
MPDTTKTRSAGLDALFNYPLMSAISDRRTRRIARGTSLVSDGLSHVSNNAPAPLSALEEAILIVSTGITGSTTHDGPLQIPGGGNELGTPFVNALGRSASSPDNSQATSFFMINDQGIFLIKRLEGEKAISVLGNLPPNRADWVDADWLAVAEAVKVKLYDQRLEFPRQFPYYLGWNKQISNRPGTTVFFPVVDCTRAYINIILNLLSEPDGQRPLFVDDWQAFKPADVVEAAEWAAVEMGFAGQKIPYEVIGGLSRAQDKFVNPNIDLPLGLAPTLRINYEAFFQLQNLMLIGQAIGLGGWVHASVAPPYILERDPAKNFMGLGFHLAPGKTWPDTCWPPTPASQPNPVGIDGVLQGLCPPYVTSMNDAVDQFLAEKYGPGGLYTDIDIFKRPYLSEDIAQNYLQNASHYSDKAIEYTKQICNYIFDTYGRFPAHVDAFHVPGVWLQFSHLELEYYEQYYKPSQFERQSQHAAMWDEK